MRVGYVEQRKALADADIEPCFYEFHILLKLPFFAVADARVSALTSCQGHHGFDVGQDSKRYKNRSKMGVEIP